jgi:hypothetical protein
MSFSARGGVDVTFEGGLAAQWDRLAANVETAALVKDQPKIKMFTAKQAQRSRRFTMADQLLWDFFQAGTDAGGVVVPGVSRGMCVGTTARVIVLLNHNTEYVSES